jgi:hypothetical protein
MVQSNFMPWRGYFDLIDDCDLFVFYDDVQYTHKGWRNRNRIKTHSGPIWVSVPVLHDHSTLIENAIIDYSGRWVAKMVRSISLAYQKARYFQSYAPGLFEILESKRETISELNIALCSYLMRQLGITTEIRKSREFGVAGDKFERPLRILRALGATSYLSGPAAKPYTDASAFRKAGIELLYKTYVYDEYPQIHGTFCPDVSVVDLLFNCGPEARAHLKSLVTNEVAAEASSSIAGT